MKIHHVGYLVKKLEKALKAFYDLGYVMTQEVVLDEYRQARICFLEKDGYVIELVSPVSKDSVVANLMKKMGSTPYHICYETENLQAKSLELESQGYVLCSEAHEAVAFDNREVCFYVHPYMGMIELLQK